MPRIKLTLLAMMFVFTWQISFARAGTLFEGWFEIYLGAKKIGYLTERYEFTPDSKFKCTYFLKTNADGGNITESLKAFANSSLAPVSYAYTSKTGDEIKIIDATFKGEQMTLKINDGKNQRKEVKKIKKGTFLSTFLLYLIMGTETAGLKLNNNYIYSAIAEEEGVAYNGQALVSAQEKVRGKDTFKILNKFKTGTKTEERFFTWITPKGEILLTRSPDKNLDVRMADNQAAATKGMMVPNQDLKLLFGNKIPGDSGAVTVSGAAGDNADASGSAKVLTPGKPVPDEKSEKAVPTPAPATAGTPAGGVEIKPPPKNPTTPSQ